MSALSTQSALLSALFLFIFWGNIYYLGLSIILYAPPLNIVPGTVRHRKARKNSHPINPSFWQIIIIFYVAAIVANKLFLFDLSPLFASAGIIGVALGFGAQSLVKDFLSGIFIIAENQYRVGDVVDVMGAAGTVERVGTRTTVIRDSEGNVHYVPNGTIQHVINKTMGYSIVALQHLYRPKF